MGQCFKLLFSGTTMAVLTINNALQAENIIPVIKDESESARMAGFGMVHDIKQVFVHQDEFKKSQKILNSLSVLK